jgi:hypothetical protein
MVQVSCITRRSEALLLFNMSCHFHQFKCNYLARGILRFRVAERSIQNLWRIKGIPCRAVQRARTEGETSWRDRFRRLRGWKSTPERYSADFLIPALLIAALHARPRLFAVFFNEEWGLAVWARLAHRTIPDRELTLGIITTCVEGSSFLGALLCQISCILRAFDAQRNRFGRLAFWIG